MTAEPMLVGGRYELSELLGRGGMAEVRRAVDSRLGRPVAVKQLRADLATDSTFQARFRREAQSAAGLNHPNVVAVYDTGEEPDPATGVMIPYIVMELVEGQTLRELLREGRKLLPERALELTIGVLDALSYSHKAGIVHRDIKPANVMLTPTGAVKVMDFGIARAVADTSATMTQTAAVIGTAQYLSPEQARGETVDARSDIYSAGCLLYELLVGRPPFVGDSPVSVAYQHVREAPVPPSTLDPEISREIDAVTLKALAKDPDDRYQSAREMKADINRVLSGQQTTAVVPRVTEPTPAATRVAPAALATPLPVRPDPSTEEDRRRPGLIVALVALALVLLGGGGWALYRAVAGNQTPAVQQVEVPTVLTYTEEQATNRLADADLRTEVEQTNGAEDTKGQVVAQDPVGGSQVDAQSSVTITVNLGPESATIPNNLEGKTLNQVEKALADAGFTNVRTDPAEDEPVGAKENEVISIRPGEGESAALDQRITVRYATGSSEVPTLTGSIESRAQELAEAAGFETRTRTRVSDQPVGVVIAQNPAAGATAKRGATITITVAAAPPEPSPSPTPPPPDDEESEEPEEPEEPGEPTTEATPGGGVPSGEVTPDG